MYSTSFLLFDSLHSSVKPPPIIQSEDESKSILRTVPPEQVQKLACRRDGDANFLHPHSIGLALIDTLDDLVHGGRIEPQLAMKVITSFDKCITEVLADKVKARLTF